MKVGHDLNLQTRRMAMAHCYYAQHPELLGPVVRAMIKPGQFMCLFASPTVEMANAVMELQHCQDRAITIGEIGGLLVLSFSDDGMWRSADWILARLRPE